MILKGIHGTCVSAANQIQKNGFSLTKEGRAGGGVYFWAYASDDSFAKTLAEDWYYMKMAKGDFKDFKFTAFSALQIEIEVEPISYINLNQVAHHERLRGVYLKLGGKATHSEVYDEYLKAYSSLVEKKHDGKQLKVVEAMVSFPPATKNRTSNALLTPGANAYIIQPIGLKDILVKDVL